MRLVVINGSPRRRKSNTSILLHQFAKGFGGTPGNTFTEVFAYDSHSTTGFIELFSKADAVFFAYPLYTDAMPSGLHEVISSLADLKERPSNPPLGFIVQSGFPEACQSRPVERYHERLAARLSCRYLGTVVKGGVEGIQIMPWWMTYKLFRRFRLLGLHFGRTGRFHPDITKALARPERMSESSRMVFRAMDLMGMTSWYWNKNLKKNGAFERRMDKPFAP